MTETIEPVPAEIDHRQITQELVEQARAEGVELIGPGGLLSGLTKTVLETLLKAEMSEHLGYDKHDPGGRDGGKSRSGTRTKTVLRSHVELLQQHIWNIPNVLMDNDGDFT